MTYNESDTFKVLKGIGLEEIEDIIDNVLKENIGIAGDKFGLINDALRPYGWSYERYIEYFY